MTGLALVRLEFQIMDAATGNERRPLGGERRLAATVTVDAKVGADGQADWRHEPINPLKPTVAIWVQL